MTVQQPKTPPAVNAKPQAPKRRSFELTLGMAQLIIVLGVVTGAMAGAFYLGFSSGQKLGYDTGLTATLSNTARLPIPDSELADATGDEGSSEIYAKLAGRLELEDEPAEGAAKSKDAKSAASPGLAAVPSSDDMPILPNNAAASANGAKAKKDNKDSTAQANGNTSGTLGDSKRSADAAKKDDDKTKVAAAVDTANKAKAEQPKVIQDKAATEVKGDTKVAAVVPAPVVKQEAVVDSKAKTEEKAKEVVVNKEATTQKAAVEATDKNAAIKPATETAAKQVVEKEAPTTTQIKSKIPAGWYVQVAAPRQAKEATDIAAKLSKTGVNVVIERADVRGEEYFRVVSGPHSQKSQAEKSLEQIKKAAVFDGDPFLRAVR